MKNEIEINDELIARYLAGEATPGEAMTLDSWLQEPANRLHFNEIEKAWTMSHPAKAPRKINLTDAWSTFDNRKSNLEISHRRNNVFLKNSLKIAASVILVLGFAYIIYYSVQSRKPAEVIAETNDSAREVRFADHSVAILNRNSVITYLEEFDDSRQVFLSKGEAFFNVQSDLRRPFIVATGVATIRVLGTSFNVMVNQDSLAVGVEQGKVLVYTSSDSVQLDAGMSATVWPGRPSFAVGESNSNVWAYATNRFIFNNTPLRNVFDYIERAQNCSISVSDPDIGNCKLSATFESVSTDNMLNLIAEALNLSVIKNDNRTFTVEGKGCR